MATVPLDILKLAYVEKCKENISTETERKLFENEFRE